MPSAKSAVADAATKLSKAGGEYAWIAVVVVILLVVAAIVLGVRYSKKAKSLGVTGSGSFTGGVDFPEDLTVGSNDDDMSPLEEALE